MTIGEKIAQRRTELGMSQMQLAIKTGYKSMRPRHRDTSPKTPHSERF